VILKFRVSKAQVIILVHDLHSTLFPTRVLSHFIAVKISAKRLCGVCFCVYLSNSCRFFFVDIRAPGEAFSKEWELARQTEQNKFVAGLHKQAGREVEHDFPKKPLKGHEFYI